MLHTTTQITKINRRGTAHIYHKVGPAGGKGIPGGARLIEGALRWHMLTSGQLQDNRRGMLSRRLFCGHNY